MEKKQRILSRYFALLAMILVLPVIALASSFTWKPSPTKSPLSQTYQKLALGMSEKEVRVLVGKATTSNQYVWTYEEMKADYETRLAAGDVPSWEKAPEVGVNYVQWTWDGKPLDASEKVPNLLVPSDYKEHAYFHVQFKDGKVKNAWYTYYRYLYRSGTDECRTRGFYYAKTECLVPDGTCPNETKYENLEPCK